MSTTRPRRRPGLRLGAGLGLATLLLTGCGGLNPGLAVSVGDDDITTGEVDELAADVCALEEANPNADPEGSGAVAGGKIRDAALQALALRSMADQIAEEYGVEAGQTYQDAVDQVELQFGGVDPELVEAAIPAYTANTYFVDILSQVGEQEAGAGASDQEKLAAGVQVAQQWEDENGIETSPAFSSFSIGEDSIESERDDLAVAVGDTARQAEEGSAEWVAGLPSSQRCN